MRIAEEAIALTLTLTLDFQETSMDLKRVDEIIDKYHAEKNWLIGIFQDIQQEYRYLPKEAIGRVATRLDIPLTQAYMVATFYKSFSLVPRGEHEIHVCLGHRLPSARRASAWWRISSGPWGSRPGRRRKT